MPWIGTAVQAGGSILGGMMAGDAAGDAAGAQMDALRGALQVQDRNTQAGIQANAPYAYTGKLANQRLRALLGLGGTVGGGPAQSYDQILQKKFGDYRKMYAEGEDGTSAAIAARNQLYQDAQQEFEGQNTGVDSSSPEYGSLTRNFTQADIDSDPVYRSGLEFGRQQGTDAINARAVQMGGYDSGATLKALTRFGNDYGSTKAGESFNRFQTNRGNVFNMLSGTSGSGLTANSMNANIGNAGAAATSSLLQDQGNVAAAGIVGRANAAQGAFGGIGTAIQGYQNNKTLEALLKNRGCSPSLSQADFSAGYY